MRVFNHHIYEFKKGVRRLILHTMSAKHRQSVIERLELNDIAYTIVDLSKDRFNVFFGERHCVDTIKTFTDKPLNEWSDEADFIIGALLGYDLVKQCERFLSRKEESQLIVNEIHAA